MHNFKLSQTIKHDIKQLFKNQSVHNILINQLQQIFQDCLSIIVIYQKLFIKIKHKQKNSSLHIQDHDFSLYMIKITKSFPLENSVRLYLLDGCYQPKIYDTRDLVYETIGQEWSYKKRLKHIVQKLPQLQQKLSKVNQNYLSMQKIGKFLLGDIFHTSLSLFVDKSKQNNSILNAISQTHFFTYRKVSKKVYKTKQQEQYENKSKTLYGKKFILSRCCELQCIESLQINVQSKEIVMNLIKYRTGKVDNQYQSVKKQIIFNEQQNLRQFLRIILKNLPKYQSTKIDFIPCYQKSSQQSSFQKVIELNQLQNRLQAGLSSSSKQLDKHKKQQLINRLNKSYQKLIEFYSARVNPYYLIYVNKLNWLYNKYFVIEQKKGDQKQEGGKKIKRSVNSQY